MLKEIDPHSTLKSSGLASQGGGGDLTSSLLLFVLLDPVFDQILDLLLS